MASEEREEAAMDILADIEMLIYKLDVMARPHNSTPVQSGMVQTVREKAAELQAIAWWFLIERGSE